MLRRAMATDMRAAKTALRREIKKVLAAVSKEGMLAQSQKAQSLVLSLPQWRAAKSVSIYLAMPVGEAQTGLLVAAALESGKRVFVPYIQARGTEGKVMRMLRLASLQEYDRLESDGWGIPTLPTEGLEGRENADGGLGLESEGSEGSEQLLDLIVVPGVAFDEQKGRLGHGAGFYDTFLARVTRVPFLGAHDFPEPHSRLH